MMMTHLSKRLPESKAGLYGGLRLVSGRLDGSARG